MDNKLPIISIIVPVYNVEEYLPSCLKSIQNQTFTDFECILINDGSTDNSGTICDDFHQLNTRFQVIHQENQGVSKARNTGLSLAKGKYISFVDSDDYIHPQMLEVLYLSISSDPSYVFSMIHGKSVFENQVISYNNVQYKELKHTIIKLNDCLIKILGDSNNGDYQYDVIWNKLYKKDIIKNQFFINEKYAEDTEYLSRIYLQTGIGCEINKELYYYVQRKSSITKNGIGIPFIRRMNVYYRIYNNIPQHLTDIKALALEKLYKCILNVRLYAKKSPYRILARNERWSIIKATYKQFITNSTPLYRKFIIFILLIIPPIYSLFITYNNRK